MNTSSLFSSYKIRKTFFSKAKYYFFLKCPPKCIWSGSERVRLPESEEKFQKTLILDFEVNCAANILTSHLILHFFSIFRALNNINFASGGGPSNMDTMIFPF